MHRFHQWMLAPQLLLGNIIHNIFFKIMTVIISKLYATVFVPHEKNVRYYFTIDRMWKNLSFLKAIVALVGQIVLNILSIVSFELFSQHFNWLSGDLERWSVGDTKKDINTFSRNQRAHWRSMMLAACQQPLFSIEHGFKGKVLVEKFPENIQKKIKKIIATSNEFTSLRS